MREVAVVAYCRTGIAKASRGALNFTHGIPLAAHVLVKARLEGVHERSALIGPKNGMQSFECRSIRRLGCSRLRRSGPTAMASRATRRTISKTRRTIGRATARSNSWKSYSGDSARALPPISA